MKRYIFLAILILIVVALLLVSYPKTTTYQGIYAPLGGQGSTPVSIELNRTISFKTIINPNKLYGSISLSPYPHDDVSIAEFDFMGETASLENNLYCVKLTRYNHKNNAVTFATLWFDRGLNNIVIAENGEQSYVYVSATEDFLNKIEQSF